MPLHLMAHITYVLAVHVQHVFRVSDILKCSYLQIVLSLLIEIAYHAQVIHCTSFIASDH